MNLDTLRRKRVKRLGVRSAGYSGQRRIFFVLDRATHKFHGDTRLWAQYIEYAREQKAFRKLSSIFTDALRLQPTNVDLWIYAAEYALEDHADMTQSRSYMQRGLRFCKSSKKLWIHYAKLELIYIAKLIARQRILGLDQDIEPSASTGPGSMDPNADTVALPRLTAEDVNPSGRDEDGVDHTALQNLNYTPALSGAIPLAIFDTAIKHFDDDSRFGHEFYDMVAEFEDVPCLRKILGHILEVMIKANPASYHTQICFIKFPTAGIRATSADFPRALGESLGRLKEHRDDRNIAQEVVAWLRPLAQTEGLDPSLQKVLAATVLSAERTLQKE